MSTGGFSDDDLLAALLAEDGFELPDTQAPGAAPRAANVPVTALSAQQRLWMMERIHGARGEFNLGLAVRFGGAAPDVAALQAALTALAQRHESLRARFEDADGEAARLVFDALDALPLAVHDVGPASMPQALQDAAARPFSLERGSLFRADLLRAPGEQVLLLGFHHAIIDLWSASLVLRELAALYAAQLGGAAADLPQPQRFGDYVAWLGDSARQQAVPALTAYWRNRLAGLPPLLELPFAGPREAGQDRCGRIAVVLAPALAADLGRFAAACGTTPFTVVLAAFNAVLARFTGQDDLAVGVPVSNRHRPHTGGTVGFLVETLVLRTDLRADPGFAALVERVREACLEDFAHQDLPLQAVVQAVNPPRLPGVQPLYQAMLVFQALPALREAAGDVLLTGQAVPLPVARADLTLELDQGRDDGAIAGWLEYREGLVDEQVAQAIAIALPVLLQAALARPSLPLSVLPLQRPADALRGLDALHPAPLGERIESAGSLAAMFERRARQSPAATALIDAGRAVSYQELDRRSATLAAHLVAQLGASMATGAGAGGAAAGIPVAVCLPRGADLAVALLAVLRAGAAFVPMDPDHPAQRLAYMLADSGASVLLAQGRPAWLPAAGAPLLIDPGMPLPEAQAPALCIGPDTLAYVLYTSGSTGEPKAVMGLHRGAVNRLLWMWDAYPFVAGEVCCQKTTPAFVDFIWEFFGPLLAGVPSVVLAHADVVDPHAFAGALARHGVTRLVVVPSLLKALLEPAADTAGLLPALRHCTVSGEALSSDLAGRFLAALPGCRLLNLYGSSEISADSTFQEVTQAGGHLVPIGRPIPGHRIAVCDAAGQALPVGVAGEIVVGGDGLALGYLGRERETRQRFQPTAALDGARGFRTGDLGRWRPDGGLDCLGRLDRQMKIRGVRVDPAEVRAALLLHPGVADAAAAGWVGTDGETVLAAWVVHLPGHAPAASALHAWLRDRLPRAALPSAYVRLAQLPLNPNGKVDVRALPAPGPDDLPASGEGNAPRLPLTAAQARLADVWERVIGSRPGSADADFFMMGGHSLNAARLAQAVRQEWGVPLDAAAVFEVPTLAAMATRIGQAAPGAGLPAIGRGAAHPGREARASSNQERLWLIEQHEAQRGAYNQVVCYRTGAGLDAGRLEQALRAVVLRHEALRTRLVLRDGLLWQQVGEAGDFSLGRRDLSGPGAEAALERFLDDEVARPTALDHALPCSATLVTLGMHDHALVISMHHTAVDGQSCEIFMRELAHALQGGDLSALPQPLQCIDVSEWQRACGDEGLWAPQLEHWRRALAAAPAVLGLQPERMPQRRSYRNARAALCLPPASMQRVTAAARQARTTPFALLLAVWAATLARFGGDAEVMVATPVSAREREGMDSAVGFFSNTVVLRVGVSGSTGLDVLARNVRDQLAEALRHQDVPFAQVVEASGVPRAAQRPALAQAMFVLSRGQDWDLVFDGQRVPPRIQAAPVSRCDLSLALLAGQGEDDLVLGGHIEYAADLFGPALAARLASAFSALLEAALQQPAAPLDGHPLCDAHEQALLDRLACAAAPPQRLNPPHRGPQRLDALLRRAAAQHPGLPAVASMAGAPQAMDYGQLSRLASAYARWLRSKGVQAGDCVALVAQRSPALIVALAGLWEAGATVVPVDPAYPGARIAAMLEDACATAVVAEAPVAGCSLPLWPLPMSLSFPVAGEPGSGVDLVEGQDQGSPGASAAPAGHGDEALACIIFTSGSTGRPKGVRVTHAALCRLAESAGTAFGIGPGSRVLQMAAFGFDVAMSDIAFALSAGACLCLASRDQLLPGAPLVGTLQAMAVTHLQIPASLLVATPVADLPCLQTLVVGGERCPDAVADAWSRGRSLFVAYGPTEATVTATAARHLPGQSPGIGRPLGDARLYVVDDKGRRVPVGVAGEIWIGGPNVSPGYVASGMGDGRFGPDPFDGSGGARLYRSGDRGRWREDGTLEFLGRMDRQIKLRGFRIEPGEIEAALLEQPGVAQAFAMPWTDAQGQQRLAAWVAGGQDLDAAALRARLRGTLAPHMVPAVVVRVDAMPLTAHGKIDSRALPQPQFDGGPDGGSRTPLPAPMPAATQARVAALWSEVLGRAGIDADANFFDVGGHSLLLVALHDRLGSDLGVSVPISELFRFTTIRSQAAYLDALRSPHAGAAPVAQRVPQPAGEQDVAVIGMACRYPGAPDLDAYWRLLLEGREGIDHGGAPDAPLPGFVGSAGRIGDADCFDAAFFGVGPRDALTFDPQHRVALECAWHTLEHAGYTPEAHGGRIGVFLGVGTNTYLRVLYPGGELPAGADTYHALSCNDKDFAASRIAYHLNLKGPAMAVQTACSSSLVAVDMACRAIREGSAEMALAGGVSIRFPQRDGYVHQPGMILSPDGRCRPFSADAGGTVPGGGVGMVLLKSLSRALADGDNVLAVVRGSAVNNDGSAKVGYTAPGADGQAAVIAAALAAARLAPGDIDYIEAHGTGTALGDPVEIAALGRVFGNTAGGAGAQDTEARSRPLALGSVKSNIGHADTAAGIAGFIKAVLAVHHGVLPASLHFSAPNPHADFASVPIEVVSRQRPWMHDGTRRAGISAFGIGGTNAHVVIEQAAAHAPHGSSTGALPQAWVLPLSARTPAALQAGLLALAGMLDKAPETSLADLSFTLHQGRVAFAWRAAVVAHGTAQAAALLRRAAPCQVSQASQVSLGDRPAQAWLFPGQGSQYPGMGRALYEQDADYRSVFDRCADGLAPHLGQDLRGILYGPVGVAVDAQALRQTELAQPALFAVSYAMASAALARGLEPAALLGHSLGEYVAACLAGVFSLDDALALVAARGRMMQALPHGAMLAAPLTQAQARELLASPAHAGIDLAAINAPQQCVFAGPVPAIDRLQAALADAGQAAMRLDTSHAFHSASMEGMQRAFTDLFDGMVLHPPQRRFLSNLTGTWITDAEATDPAYWACHLRAPVRFADGLKTLRAEGIGVLAEFGPGRVLGKLAGANGWAADALAPSALQRSEGAAAEPALDALHARLWCLGAASRPGRLPPAAGRRIPLPGYAFERIRHWPAEVAGKPHAPAAPSLSAVSPASPFLGDVRAAPPKLPDMADWFHVPGWRREPAAQAAGIAAPAAASLRWMVVGVHLPAGAALAQALSVAGQQVLAVSAGQAFAQAAPGHFTIGAGDHQDFRRLLDALPEHARPQRIVHLEATRGGAPDDLLRRGFFGVLGLARALGSAVPTWPVRLDIVTTGAADVDGDEALAAGAATLLGAVKVLPLEYPNLDCRLIDVRDLDGPGAGEALQALAAELLRTDPLEQAPQQPVVALRRGRRWVPQFTAQRLPEPLAGQARFRPAGVYVLTGGFGGMGSALARELAGSGAHLVLLGRHVDASLVAQLQSRGAQVLALACDVSDARALGDALARARSRFGRVDGVLHAAGVADQGGVVHNRDDASIATAMAAKVQGALALDAALAGHEPDFVVLFSSLGTVVPGSKFGQIGYAAANEFLALFAAERTARRGGFTQAIDWDDWTEVGMTVMARQRWGLPALAASEGLTPAEGVAVLRRALASPHPRVSVCVRDLPSLLRLAGSVWTDAAAAPAGLPASGEPAQPPEQGGEGPDTRQRLAAVWREVLGVAEIGAQSHFFELGGHSLIAMRVLAYVREHFGVELGIAAVFEHPVLGDLADFVDACRPMGGTVEEFTL